MLTLKNLNYAVCKNTKFEQKILDDLSLEIQAGEFTVVMGNNGAGKSSLLKVIAGLSEIDAGECVIDGQDLSNDQTARRKLVATVVQDPKVGTCSNMTIYENLALAFRRNETRWLRPYDTLIRRELFKKKLSLFKSGLENRLDDFLSDLSGGQRQAISLAMVLLSPAKILLLDEITSALDPTAAENIMNLLQQINRAEKLTCIMVTHNLQQAIKYADKIVVLGQGRVIKTFSSSEISELKPAILHNFLEL